MQINNIVKKIVRTIFLSIVVLFLMALLFSWYNQRVGKTMCNEFASKSSLKSTLMDETFKILLSTKNIKNFRTYGTGYIMVYSDNSEATIDWIGVLDDPNLGITGLVYQYFPRYEKEIQSGIARLEMIESIYVGDTREGLRFILKRTQQGAIDEDDYTLDAVCNLRGDRQRQIKIKP